MDSPRAPRLLVARRFAWVFTGESISKIAVLATSLIAVRALAPVEFGIYLGLVATTIIAAALWDLGVSTVLTRELAAERLTTRQAVVRAAELRVRSLPVWVGTFALGSAILGSAADVPPATYAVFGATSVVIACHTIALSVLRARLRFKTAALVLAVGRWGTAAVSLLALPTPALVDPFLMLAIALLAGEVITLVSAIAASALQNLRSAGDTGSTDGARASRITLRASLPFAANSVLNLVYNRLDVVILAALSSPQQLALYAPATRIQDAFHLIPGAISVVGLPMIARSSGPGSDGRETRSLITQLMLIGVTLSLPVSVLGFVYAPAIIDFVLGPDYLGAVKATRILIWSLPLSALTAVLVAALAATGHALDTTRVFVVAFTVATLAHLSLDWWLGATGAAIASLSREPAALAAAFIYSRRARLIGTVEPSHVSAGTT